MGKGNICNDCGKILGRLGMLCKACKVKRSVKCYRIFKKKGSIGHGRRVNEEINEILFGR